MVNHLKSKWEQFPVVGAHKESENALKKPDHWHLLRSLFEELCHQFFLFPKAIGCLWVFYTFAKQNTDYFKNTANKFSLSISGSGLSCNLLYLETVT